MDLYSFCTCAPRQYDRLKQQVDACAAVGRSYEFRQCAMPAGCVPDRADLGFWRQGGRYFLYLRPGVDYRGADPKLARFFASGRLQDCGDFSALTDRLRSLAPLPHSGREGEEGGPKRLERLLRARLVGQEEAVEAAAFKLYGHISKPSPARPLSLVFYGPTGVGKSELGKAAAPVLNRFLGQDRYRLVWTELNTFTEAHSAYRLTGAPPGYAGYEDPAVLEEVRKNPCTVFMFDELDKAHPEVLKVFMSILDEGRCAARRGDEAGARELDFRRCILLFTTNTDLSAPERQPLGFAAPQAPPVSPGGAEKAAGPAGPTGLAQRLLRADERARRALISNGVLREIAGRFSGLIGFRPLSSEERWAVTGRQIAALGREYGLDIAQVSPAIARALTPGDALSLRSTAGVLEGALTPLFLLHAGRGGGALRLAGTAEEPLLLPLPPQTAS